MESAEQLVPESSCGEERQDAGNRSQYLTFYTKGEIYGVDILRVQEIRSWEKVTRIPNSPLYVMGVVNIRGSIVPVSDLGKRMELSGIEYSEKTAAIVLSVNSDNGTRAMGIVVDEVSDVISVYDSEVMVTPEFGTRVMSDFVKGIVAVQNETVMLLDIDRVLDIDQDT